MGTKNILQKVGGSVVDGVTLAAVGVIQAAVDYQTGRSLRKLVDEIDNADEDRAHEDDVLHNLEKSFGEDEQAEMRKRLTDAGVKVDDRAEIHQLTMEGMVRDMLYDAALEDPEEILTEMGYPAPSPEVAEASHMASAKRRAVVEPLDPFIHAMSQAALLPTARRDEWDDEEYEEEYEFLAHACMAIIAKLIDMRLLAEGSVSLATTVLVHPEMENDDE